MYIADSIVCFPSPVPHADYDNSSMLPGNTVIYSCHYGYQHHHGNLTRTCQDNGEWDGLSPTCQGEAHENTFTRLVLFIFCGNVIRG